MSAPFADRLVDAILAKGAPACVGLDPVLDRIAPQAKASEAVDAIETFCKRIVDDVCDHVPAVKPQSACFERYGSAGVAVLERVCSHARQRGLIVVLDAKRGDIALTGGHYAAAAAHVGADAVTVNGYLGPSSVAPWLEAGLGVFVLVRTSNDDAGAVQAREAADGLTIAETMAGMVASCGEAHVGAHGYSEVGAVVAPTTPEEGRRLRDQMKKQIFLVPGYGAQGKGALHVQPLLDARSAGVLATASRSVIYAEAGAQEAARRFADEVRDLCAGG